jgi:hypothetical protein
VRELAGEGVRVRRLRSRRRGGRGRRLGEVHGGAGWSGLIWWLSWKGVIVLGFGGGDDKRGSVAVELGCANTGGGGLFNARVRAAGLRRPGTGARRVSRRLVKACCGACSR